MKRNAQDVMNELKNNNIDITKDIEEQLYMGFKFIELMLEFEEKYDFPKNGTEVLNALLLFYISKKNSKINQQSMWGIYGRQSKNG